MARPLRKELFFAASLMKHFCILAFISFPPALGSCHFLHDLTRVNLKNEFAYFLQIFRNRILPAKKLANYIYFAYFCELGIHTLQFVVWEAIE